jgi:hypothetical protein
MKSLSKVAGLLVATSLAAVACAQGTMADDAALATEIKTTEPPPQQPDDNGKPISQGDDSSSKPDAGSNDPGNTTGDAGSKPPPAPPAAPPACTTTTPPSNKCGLTPQCGCASNETCDVTGKSNGAVSCVAAGTKAQGKSCSTTSDCAMGLTCAYGNCRPYCSKAGSACTGTGLGACEEVYDQGKAIPNDLVCAITCDLQNPSAACGSGTCVYDSPAKTTDCDKPGSLGAFATCSNYNDCKPGLACVNSQLFGTECEPWCRIGVSGDCPFLSSCVDVYGQDAPTQGSTKLGHCQ